MGWMDQSDVGLRKEAERVARRLNLDARTLHLTFDRRHSQLVSFTVLHVIANISIHSCSQVMSPSVSGCSGRGREGRTHRYNFSRSLIHHTRLTRHHELPQSE